MKVKLYPKQYVEYLEIVADKIKENKDYITKLDAETGDGDHWANMNTGFEKLMQNKEELSSLNLAEMFNKIAMTLMSGIGGSSGILYGSAYLKAAQVSKGKEYIDIILLEQILKAQLDGIMQRGNAGPGYKTMIDPLFQAQEAMKDAINEGKNDKDILLALKYGAETGKDATVNMEAKRGRACYRPDRGVGHLDPGAVTMYYQLSLLADYLLR